VFQWVEAQGGVAALEKQNIAKAHCLYHYLDSTDFYFNVIHKPVRSRMNVPFFLHDEALTAAFLAGAEAAGLKQLQGHKSIGGIRASLYNALPLKAVQALVAYMQDFEKRYG
jgi:phosphoserine aminotransferase